MSSDKKWEHPSVYDQRITEYYEKHGQVPPFSSEYYYGPDAAETASTGGDASRSDVIKQYLAALVAIPILSLILWVIWLIVVKLFFLTRVKPFSAQCI